MPKTEDRPSPVYRTFKNLRLNIEEAKDGRTWLLLPDGFRDRASGRKYPLPTAYRQIEQLAIITLPPGNDDSGTVYLKRARRDYNERQKRRASAAHDIKKRMFEIKTDHKKFTKELETLKAEAQSAIESVKKEAEERIADLNDLFDLARKGLDGQMKAHLDNIEWQGEKISASGFRECARLVTQTVKALGIPSDQRPKAQTAIFEQVAKGMRETQETVEMAGGAILPEQGDKEH